MPDKKISQLVDGGASQALDAYVIARTDGVNYKIAGTAIAAAATSVGTLSSLAVSGDLTVDTSTLKVDSTNNRVGVGTASPDVTLDLEAAAGSSTALVMLKNTSGASASNIAQMQFWSGNTFGGLEQIASIHGINPNAGSNNGGTLVFSTSSNGTATTPTERMRLDASGNLGIGTSSPLQRLHVAGSVFRHNDATNSFGYTISAASAKITQAATAGGIYFAWQTNGSGTDQMTLDTSGNLGLGVTPSAWSASFKALQVSGLGALWGSSTGFFMSNNTYNDGSNKYIGNGLATRYYQSTGQHIWENAPNNTSGAGASATLTQAMTLDASGNLGVGTTSPQTKLHVAGEGAFWATGNDAFRVVPLTAGSGSKFLSTNSANNAYAPAIIDGSIVAFQTSGSERARITSGGYFKASDAGTYAGSTGNYHEFRTSASTRSPTIQNTHATQPFGILIEYTAAAPNGAGNDFVYCSDNAAARAVIRSNGGFANYQANDVNLSDERVKTDIKPVGSYWDKLKAIEIVTFKYKDQTHDDDNIGVIAQQVEAVAPEFIDVDGFGETPEDGIPLKTVYTTDMYHAAIKALQEAMARIESLEARLAALES